MKTLSMNKKQVFAAIKDLDPCEEGWAQLLKQPGTVRQIYARFDASSRNYSLIGEAMTFDDAFSWLFRQLRPSLVESDSNIYVYGLDKCDEVMEHPRTKARVQRYRKSAKKLLKLFKELGVDTESYQW